MRCAQNGWMGTKKSWPGVDIFIVWIYDHFYGAFHPSKAAKLLRKKSQILNLYVLQTVKYMPEKPTKMSNSDSANFINILSSTTIAFIMPIIFYTFQNSAQICLWFAVFTLFSNYFKLILTFTKLISWTEKNIIRYFFVFSMALLITNVLCYLINVWISNIILIFLFLHFWFF